MDRLRSVASGLAVERHDDPAAGVVLRLNGDVDLVSSPVLDRALTDVAWTRPRKVIIDLSAVGFLDSSGLRTLLSGQRQLEEIGSDLVVRGANPSIRRVFELTGLDTLLHTE